MSNLFLGVELNDSSDIELIQYVKGYHFGFSFRKRNKRFWIYLFRSNQFLFFLAVFYSNPYLSSLRIHTLFCLIKLKPFFVGCLLYQKYLKQI